GDVRPSRRPGGGGDRGALRSLGRDREGGRDRPARCGARPGRADRLDPGPAGPLQVPHQRRPRHRAAEERHRQAAQAPAPRPVLAAAGHGTSVSSPLHPVALLARRFCVDWLDRADASVPPEIMTPGYRVHIGRAGLDGLDAYTAGTLGPLTQFAGLLLTVHQLVSDGDQLALHFTEHGASTRHGGRAAAWRGVALFRIEDGRLAENWTQEDYYSRRRQLADGPADPVPAPAISPW